MLLPVLQRFYGGSWDEWERMPVRLLDCYVKMMPVIKAEETLMKYQAVVLGNGPKSRAQVHRMRSQVRELVKTTRRYGGARPTVARPSSAEDMRSALQALGIRVKEVQKSA